MVRFKETKGARVNSIGKFYIALSAALGVAVSVSADGTLPLADWFAIASAGVGAIAAYYMPKSSEPQTPAPTYDESTGD